MLKDSQMLALLGCEDFNLELQIMYVFIFDRQFFHLEKGRQKLDTKKNKVIQKLKL